MRFFFFFFWWHLWNISWSAFTEEMWKMSLRICDVVACVTSRMSNPFLVEFLTTLNKNLVTMFFARTFINKQYVQNNSKIYNHIQFQDCLINSFASFLLNHDIFTLKKLQCTDELILLQGSGGESCYCLYDDTISSGKFSLS